MIKLTSLLSELKNDIKIGININDKYEPWTDHILNKRKTIETRNSKSLHPYIGKRIGIIRTGKGKAELVGYATIGNPVFYKTQEEFDADYDKHMVNSDMNYYIGPNGKYGYPMLDVEKTTPKKINSRGIVSRKL